ncbi:hypothetical protein B0H13DRAFT_2123885 [Mycena leptocephala]|nr:hypothetical protein B0H13DRAFT_2123885 [Mycena leptocephala]
MSTKDCVRNIALSTPALWASLHIPLEYVLDGIGYRVAPLEWLARSGCCALSLSIVGAQRERDVDWEDNDSDGVDTIIQALSGANEGLLRLRDIQQLKLLTTPSLRDVTLRVLHFDQFIPQMPLRWEHLTHLTFEQSSSSFDANGLSPNAPLVLSALREFVILRQNSWLGPRTIGYILQNLLMPQLRHYNSRAYFGAASNSSLLPRTLSMLRRLVLFDSNGREDNASHTAATVQRLFAILVDSETLFPLLAELQLRECLEPASRNEDVLFDFARQQLDHGAGHFKRFDIQYAVPMPPIAPNILTEFAARGLIISTSHTASWGHAQPPLNTPWMGLEHSSY